MATKTITLADIQNELAGLDLTLNFDDGSWSVDAESELLGSLGAFPCESRADAFQDIAFSIDREIGRVMFAQLTHYQVAVMSSAFRRTCINTVDLDSPQQIPHAVHVSALDRLGALGLAEMSGEAGERTTYCGRMFAPSGWALTEGGRLAARWFEESEGRKLLDHPRVIAAQLKLGVTATE